ncbi:universal stress protein [[Flexibacter] sp. ATCC 35208]|uniref:universal stress protein n=1 Tax=[Flexibacter] sp. ATCC 35208 TaxID=1936242 RepID=UPI0009D25CE7|nr:universal stress protein [[Flexibacter] sp. ATCC 35208]OMP75524.1 hypothetical protein BW716_29570 [[Flexibacter] sp. ATCC 35208]
MKTMLIPVDFTATNENTIRFASEWAHRFGYDRIILLKTFYDTVFDNIAVSAEYAPVSQDFRWQERKESTEKLDHMADELSARMEDDMAVLTAVSEAPLLRAINETIREESVDMVLLGSDSCQSNSNSFIAGNIISIAKISPVRVLVVPSHYSFRPINDVLLPCDYRMMGNLAKLNDPKDSAMAKEIQLHVLNVDAKERYINPDENFKNLEAHLHSYLQNFKHDINYSNEKNIIDGIIKYTNVNDFQLIISLPGKHSFLYYLTNKSISEAICRNAKVPVLILK